ncbi:MAG: phosphodiester glycosidase family protein [Clostridia bacterium]|nr:phosphodiester glycosidase family protein [Clostridia bacterium]
MVEISEEELVSLDNLADGLSEVRKYKSKQPKKDKNKEPAPPPINEEKVKKDKKRIKALPIMFLIFAVTVLLCVVSYVTVVYGNIPFVVKWRNIWIETAMTTDQHKWLATTFFPDRLIDEIMAKQVDIKDISITDIYGNQSKDVLGQENLTVGEPDKFGNEVYVNDKEENIVILKVKNSTFEGKLVLIDDPSRVSLAVTDYKNSRGEFICDYLEKENGIVGINASGFSDPGGTSLGGVVTGQCVSSGEYWGTYNSKYTLLGFDENNRLVVGGMENWQEYNIRDGMQYRPTLIIDGIKVVEDSAGWGLQPRTVVGQCENGVVMFLVVDGRQVGYSLGATMEDCADILLQYGAVTAGACDGGSSSVIAYDGDVISKPSARQMPTGRYLPNAWVVERKTTPETQK